MNLEKLSAFQRREDVNAVPYYVSFILILTAQLATLCVIIYGSDSALLSFRRYNVHVQFQNYNCYLLLKYKLQTKTSC